MLHLQHPCYVSRDTRTENRKLSGLAKMTFFQRVKDVFEKHQARRVARFQIENLTERQLNDLGLSKKELRAILEV